MTQTPRCRHQPSCSCLGPVAHTKPEQKQGRVLSLLLSFPVWLLGLCPHNACTCVGHNVDTSPYQEHGLSRCRCVAGAGTGPSPLEDAGDHTRCCELMAAVPLPPLTFSRTTPSSEPQPEFVWHSDQCWCVCFVTYVVHLQELPHHRGGTASTGHHWEHWVCLAAQSHAWTSCCCLN